MDEDVVDLSELGEKILSSDENEQVDDADGGTLAELGESILRAETATEDTNGIEESGSLSERGGKFLLGEDDSEEKENNGSSETIQSLGEKALSGEDNNSESVSDDLNRLVAPTEDSGYEAISDFDTVVEKDTAFGYGIDRFQRGLAQAGASIGDLTGIKSLSEWSKKQVAQQERDIAEGGYQSYYKGSIVETYKRDGLFAGLGHLGEAMLENWVDVGLAVATGGAAAIAKKGAFKGLSLAASRTAVTAGTVGTLGSGIGEVRDELESQGLYDENNKLDAATAVGVGLAIGMIDRLAGGAANDLVPNKGEALKALAKDGTLREMGESLIKYTGGKLQGTIVTKVGVEAATEAVQEATIIGTAALQGGDYTQGEVLNRLIDSALIGGGFGLGGHTVNKISDKIFTGDADNLPSEDAGDIDGIPAQRPRFDDPEQQAKQQSLAAIRKNKIIENANTSEIQRPNINIAQAKKNIKDTGESWNTQDRQNKLMSSYTELVTTDYSTWEAERVEATKQEIDALLEDMGLTIEVDDTFEGYKKEEAIVSDVFGNNTVKVTPLDKTGLLSETVEGQNYTYAEALQGIHTAYSKAAAATSLNDFGEGLAAESTIAMFSPSAEPLVSAQVITGQNTPYLISRAVRSDVELQDAEPDTIFPTALRKGEVGPPPPERRSAASQLLEEQQKGDTIVGTGLIKVAEKIVRLAERNNQPDATREGGAREKIGNAIALASGIRNKEAYKTVRENESLRATAANQLKAFSKNLDKQIGKYVKSNPLRFEGSKKEILRGYRNIMRGTLTGEYDILTKEGEQGLANESTVYVQNGNIFIQNKATKETLALPSEFAGPLLRARSINQQKQGIVLQKLKSDIADKDAEVANAEEKIEQYRQALEDEMLSLENGTAGLEYTAFKSNKQSTKFAAEVLDKPNGGYNYLRDMANEAITRTAEATLPKGKDLKKYINELDALYQTAFRNSDSIEQFVEKTNGVFGDAQNLDLGIAASLGGFKGSTTTILSEISKLNAARKSAQKTTDFYNKIKSDPYYLHTSYRGYTDPQFAAQMRNPTTKEAKARRDNYLNEKMQKLEAKGMPKKEAREQAQADLELELNQSKVDGQGNQGLFSSADAMRKRKDLTPAFKEFYGEITDPLEAMQHTIREIAEVQIDLNLRNKLWDEIGGKGIFLNREDAQNVEGVDPLWLVKRKMPVRSDILGDRRHTDVYVTPAVAGALDMFVTPQQSDNMVIGWLQRYTAAFKRSLTILNIDMAITNFIGQQATTINSGFPVEVFIPQKDRPNLNYLTGITSVYKYLRGQEVKNKEWREAIELVLGGEAHANELDAARNLSEGALGALIGAGRLLDATATDAVVGTASKVGKAIEDAGIGAYRFGDLFSKALFYQTRLAQYKRHYKTLSEAELKAKALQVTNDLAFDAYQVPKIVRDAANTTVIGGAFVTYPVLSYNVAVNNLKQYYNERQLEKVEYGERKIKNFDPQNKAHMALASAAITANPIGPSNLHAASMIGAAYAVSGISMAAYEAAKGLFGDEEEKRDYVLNSEETSQNLINILPEYYQDQSVGTLRGTNEELMWFSASRLSNFGVLHEAINAINNLPEDASPDDVIHAASMTIVGDAFQQGFGLQAMEALRRNDNGFGMKIYDDNANLAEKTMQISSYLYNETYGKSSVGKALGGVGSVLKDEEYNVLTQQQEGRTWGDILLEESGLNPKTINFKQQLTKLGFGYKKRIAATKTEARSILYRSKSVIGEEDLSKAAIKHKAQHNQFSLEMISQINSMRYFGMSEDTIGDRLKAAGLNKDTILSLRAGIVPASGIESFKSAKTKKPFSDTDEINNRIIDSNFEEYYRIYNKQ